jgi:hypothetical protein
MPIGAKSPHNEAYMYSDIFLVLTFLFSLGLIAWGVLEAFGRPYACIVSGSILLVSCAIGAFQAEKKPEVNE